MFFISILENLYLNTFSPTIFYPYLDKFLVICAQRFSRQFHKTFLSPLRYYSIAQHSPRFSSLRPAISRNPTSHLFRGSPHILHTYLIFESFCFIVKLASGRYVTTGRPFAPTSFLNPNCTNSLLAQLTFNSYFTNTSLRHSHGYFATRLYPVIYLKNRTVHQGASYALR